MKTVRLPRGEALWLSASPARALGESVGVSLLAVLLLTRFGTQLFTLALSQVSYTLILFTGPAMGLWCATRMRQRASFWNSLPRDAVAGMVTAIVPAALAWLIAYALPARERLAPHTLFDVHVLSLQLTVTATVMSVVAYIAVFGEYVGLRIGVRLLRRWNRMRRSRLRWALTHAHLTVVLLGVAMVGMLLFAVSLRSPANLPFRVLPTLLLLSILTLFALAVVLPPSALFSYLFARRTTRRLEALTSATNQLRAGDYSVRVPVDGADEVAQLQSNFNTMAADLERAVAELERERDRVAMLLQARRELVASVSHEVRTPLATLRGYLESALTHWDTAPPDTLRHDLTVMERETGHLQTLIDDLFLLARAEVGKLELRCEPTDVGQVVRQLVEAASPAAWQTRRVQLLAEVDADLPLALVDAGRVRQILHNLVHNATRHTPPGGIVVAEARAAEALVVLRVKDTGEGIAAEDLPFIWQRFYRGRTAEHADGSSGLGLALVKELSEAMGGSVDVASTRGEGSVFTVLLPRVESGPRAHRATPQTHESARTLRHSHPLPAVRMPTTS